MQNRIKERIQAQGLPLNEVAHRLGMSVVGLSIIVNKSAMPRLATLEKIADAIGLPIWKLCLTDDEIEEIRGCRDGGSGTLFCPKCGTSVKVEFLKDGEAVPSAGV